MGFGRLSKRFAQNREGLSMVKKTRDCQFFASRPPAKFLSFHETFQLMMIIQSFLKNILPLTCGLALSTSAFGQLEVSKDAKFKVDDPKFETLQSPVISDGNGKNFKPKDWLEVEVKLKAAVRKEPADGYLDQIRVNWHVVVKGQDRKKYKISKTVTYVNLPVDEESMSRFTSRRILSSALPETQRLARTTSKRSVARLSGAVRWWASSVMVKRPVGGARLSVVSRRPRSSLSSTNLRLLSQLSGMTVTRRSCRRTKGPNHFS